MKKREIHKKTHSPVYLTWTGMRQRCNNKNHTFYPRYGGVGIKVCKRWDDSFIKFLEDMGDRPLGTTIDRIDNYKGYCKGNCRWATKKEQSNNLKATLRIKDLDGKILPANMFAEKHNLSHSIVRKRILEGMTTEEILDKPLFVKPLRSTRFLRNKKQILKNKHLLKNRYSELISIRFGVDTGKTLSQISVAKQFGVSRQAINQKEDIILNLLMTKGITLNN